MATRLGPNGARPAVAAATVRGANTRTPIRVGDHEGRLLVFGVTLFVAGLILLVVAARAGR